MKIAALIQDERLLEPAQPGLKTQKLRRGPGEQEQLIGILSRFCALLDALVTQL